MFKLLNNFWYPGVLVYAFVALATGCDDEPGVNDITLSPPSVENLNVDPDSLNFSINDGEKDTTITFRIEAEITGLENEESVPQFIITDEQTSGVLAEGPLEQVSDNGQLFATDVGIELSTTTIANWKLSVFIFDERGRGNRIETLLSINGFSSNPPEILEVNNPDTVARPQSGSETVQFTAKVTDPDGQETIDQVFIELINPDDVSTGTFRMRDDGSIDAGDAVAGDSVFTVTFSLDNSSRAGTFELFYFAFDRVGLASDTVQNQIVIE